MTTHDGVQREASHRAFWRRWAGIDHSTLARARSREDRTLSLNLPWTSTRIKTAPASALHVTRRALRQGDRLRRLAIIDLWPFDLVPQRGKLIADAVKIVPHPLHLAL